MDKNRRIKVLELFCGIGGMHYALKGSSMADIAEVILAVDINPLAFQVYKANFPGTNFKRGNIESFTADAINELSPHMLIMSPPCQPFTRNGLQKDVQDTRTHSLTHITNLIPKLRSISCLLVENVKGFETSKARDALLESLKEAKFVYEEFLLNPSQFEICNSRLRYYLVAYRSLGKDFQIEQQATIKREMSFAKDFNIPRCISEILEQGWPEATDKDQKRLQKYFAAIDVVDGDSRTSCCFTKNYGRFLRGTGSVLRIGNDLRLFTPREVARLMTFPEEFSFPPQIMDGQKYKLLGNSVNVWVVSRLLSYLHEIIQR